MLTTQKLAITAYDVNKFNEISVFVHFLQFFFKKMSTVPSREMLRALLFIKMHFYGNRKFQKAKYVLCDPSPIFLFRPLMMGGGGGVGTIYSNGFFVRTILTDRYNNRREL